MHFRSSLDCLLVWLQARPFDPKAAMVLEAQWDRPRSAQRGAVTACLPRPGHGEIVMASASGRISLMTPFIEANRRSPPRSLELLVLVR